MRIGSVQEDRLIERLRAAVNGKQPDRLNELLAGLLERSASGARAVRELTRELLRPRQDKDSLQRGCV